MGVRGCESKCLFSGSRGEVCTLEPLLLNHIPSHPLKNYTLVAMATLSKVYKIKNSYSSLRYENNSIDLIFSGNSRLYKT